MPYEWTTDVLAAADLPTLSPRWVSERRRRVQSSVADVLAPDRRLAQIALALDALHEPGPGRAETVQRLFSLPYDPTWPVPKPK